MSDPYKILGVSPDASDDEIKSAYRELAKKYHPDAYHDNPLADLASDKMKEINEAYDKIVEQRRNGGGRSSSGGGAYRQYSGGTGSQGTSSQFADIRRLISSNRITEAEELLDGVPSHMRDAEWYFLKGNVQYSRGWLDDAFENMSRACSMNPQNAEYQSARNQLLWQRQTGRAGYRTAGTGRVGGYSMCDICTTLYCADCCCECMGGDLLGCC